MGPSSWVTRGLAGLLVASVVSLALLVGQRRTPVFDAGHVTIGSPDRTAVPAGMITGADVVSMLGKAATSLAAANPALPATNDGALPPGPSGDGPFQPHSHSSMTLLQWLRHTDPFSPDPPTPHASRDPLHTEPPPTTTVAAASPARAEPPQITTVVATSASGSTTAVTTTTRPAVPTGTAPFVAPYRGARVAEVDSILLRPDGGGVTAPLLFLYHTRKAAGTTMFWFLFLTAMKHKWKFAHVEGLAFDKRNPMRNIDTFCDFSVMPNATERVRLKWEKDQWINPSLLADKKKGGGTCCTATPQHRKYMYDECKSPWFKEWAKTHPDTAAGISKDAVFVTTLRSPLARIVSSYVFEGRWRIWDLMGRSGKKLIPTDENATPFEQWIGKISATKFFKRLKIKRGSNVSTPAARAALDNECGSDTPRHWECATECYTKWFSGYPCLGKVGDHSNPNEGERPVARLWLDRARATLSNFDLIVRTESMRDPGYIEYIQKMFNTNTEMTQVFAYSADKPRPKYTPDAKVRQFMDDANTFDIVLYREFALGPGM